MHYISSQVHTYDRRNDQSLFLKPTLFAHAKCIRPLLKEFNFSLSNPIGLNSPSINKNQTSRSLKQPYTRKHKVSELQWASWSLQTWLRSHGKQKFIIVLGECKVDPSFTLRGHLILPEKEKVCIESETCHRRYVTLSTQVFVLTWIHRSIDSTLVEPFLASPSRFRGSVSLSLHPCDTDDVTRVIPGDDAIPAREALCSSVSAIVSLPVCQTIAINSRKSNDERRDAV